MDAKKILIVCDRGALDNKAYMTPTEFSAVLNHLKKNEVWLWLNRVLTFSLLLIPLTIFRANNLGDGVYALKKIISDLSIRFLYFDFLFYLQKGIWFILLVLFLVEYCVEYKKTHYIERHFLCSHIIMSGLLIVLIFALGEFNGGQFIYFQF